MPPVGVYGVRLFAERGYRHRDQSQTDLVVEYRYTDKKGNNTTHEEVGHTASLLFDPAGVFLREITAFGERFTDSMTLLSGRSRRRIYGRVVRQRGRHGTSRTNARSVGNYGVAVQKRKTRGQPHRRASFPRLTRFTVQRGRPQVRRIDLNKKYFRIELSVTGADSLSGSADDFRVTFDGIPAGIDYRGEPLQETIRFTPLLEKTKRER